MLRRTCAQSVQGASHIRSGQPCQDSYLCMGLPGGITILAAADGHGSKSCPFSRTGARIAVHVFCSVIGELLENFDGRPELLMAYLNREGELKIAQAIDREWKERVLDVYANHRRAEADSSASEERTAKNSKPETAREGRLKEECEPETACEPQPGTSPEPEDVCRLYGTTLLGLLLTPQFLFAFQIGDGDILCIDADQVHPVIVAEKFLGTQTNSLSGADAWKKAVTLMRRLDDNRTLPVLYLMSTDGFANSHVSEQAFGQTCREYYEMIGQYGFDAVAASLKSWLLETSELGCGDDITVVLHYICEKPDSSAPEERADEAKTEPEPLAIQNPPDEEKAPETPSAYEKDEEAPEIPSAYEKDEEAAEAEDDQE